MLLVGAIRDRTDKGRARIARPFPYQYEVCETRYYDDMYFVYLLECEDGSIYTGITTDVARRFKEHQAGIGSHFTRAKKAKRILYTEEHPSRSSALKREAEIKTWPREKKLSLVGE